MKLVQIIEEEIYQGSHAWEAMAWKDVVGETMSTAPCPVTGYSRKGWGGVGSLGIIRSYIENSCRTTQFLKPHNAFVVFKSRSFLEQF